MAIQFAEESVVSAGWPDGDERGCRRPESAVAAAAYLGRRRMKSAATGKTYDYRPRRGARKGGSKRGRSGVGVRRILVMSNSPG